MILLLDNYDSFTYNLVDYLSQMHVDIKIFRNDDPFEQIIQQTYSGVILSPGPGIPETSGHLITIINHYQNSLPILGICLGHQAIGIQFGAKLVKAYKPMHGKLSSINIEQDYIFYRIPSKLRVVRYHSLILEELPTDLVPIAFTDQGEVMAIKHNFKNIRGVQFHPEAILTEYGFEILKNWIHHNKIFSV